MATTNRRANRPANPRQASKFASAKGESEAQRAERIANKGRDNQVIVLAAGEPVPNVPTAQDRMVRVPAAEKTGKMEKTSGSSPTPSGSSPKPKGELPFCQCGCGTKVVRKTAKFVSGHDATLKSRLIREALEHEVANPGANKFGSQAHAELKTRDWAKFLDVSREAKSKKRAKTRKPAANPADGNHEGERGPVPSEAQAA